MMRPGVVRTTWGRLELRYEGTDRIYNYEEKLIPSNNLKPASYINRQFKRWVLYNRSTLGINSEENQSHYSISQEMREIWGCSDSQDTINQILTVGQRDTMLLLHICHAIFAWRLIIFGPRGLLHFTTFIYGIPLQTFVMLPLQVMKIIRSRSF